MKKDIKQSYTLQSEKKKNHKTKTINNISKCK
jgi:hypothetical protein